MKKFLQGKVLTVIGGSGFVGSAVCRQASLYGFQVNGISRRGYPPGYEQHWTKNVNWVRGDAMHPESIAPILQQSDIIVHTVGTLIDTTITKGRKPGESGTYEQMNRDALINIAKQIEGAERKPIIVYISASQSPPFIPRYLSTKREAEKYLQDRHAEGKLNHVILRPGFIYSWSDRWWSVPLKANLDIWGKVYNAADCLVPKQSFIGGLWKEFRGTPSVKLTDLIDASLYPIIDGSLIGQCLENRDIETNANHFRSRLQADDK